MPTTAYSQQIFQLFVLSAFLVFPTPFALADETAVGQPFTINDYFKIQRVVELSLSSDGAMVVYAVESPSLEENKTVRTVYVSEAAPGTEPILIESIQNGRSLAWIPGTHQFAFLLSDDDTTQVYSIDTENYEIRQHTRGDDRVVRFSFAPNGAALAWITIDPEVNGNPEYFDYEPSSLYEQLFSGEEGVVIDSESTNVYNFVNPEQPDFSVRPPNQLWLKQPGTAAFQIDVPGQVRSLYWSSDTPLLSILYVADDMPKKILFDRYTSLGVFDVTTKAFQVLAGARPPSEEKRARYYRGGEWIPGEDKLFVRRITERDIWVRTTEWSLFDLATDDVMENGNHSWQEIEIYFADSAFLPANANAVYSNKTVRARQSLYQITPTGMERANILHDLEGSISLIQFSADFEKAAFVNESLTRPPEIYVWRKGHGSKQLSRLNRETADKQLPIAREIIWKSRDDVTVQGWLLEPVGRKSGNTPWPMMTFVHGGPGLAMPDKFAYYFLAAGGLWPYPLEVYALNGIAVFIPNYRGTQTFGRKFADPASLDGEPVDDIISGIAHLIGEGIADPDRLAISGHSHGVWLASLVLTRAKKFRAASFAEGILNAIVNYSLMSARLNREVHDIKQGASLYEDPQRYIDISPDMHFEGLDAAVLFEAGAKSYAIGMMGSPKAARRAGMPAEFIIYPKTGHNIWLPRQQKESAERNFDWLRFWLFDSRDPNPKKAEQYRRWRGMRPPSEEQN